MDESRRLGNRALSTGRVSSGTLISAPRFSTASAEPGNPALSGNHPPTQPQAGNMLISEQRCVSQRHPTRLLCRFLSPLDLP